MRDEKKLPIKAWAKDDRPREKLLEQGKSALSDAELKSFLKLRYNTMHVV